MGYLGGDAAQGDGGGEVNTFDNWVIRSAASVHNVDALTMTEPQQLAPSGNWCRDMKARSEIVVTIFGPTRESIMLPHELAEAAQERAENAATEVRS